MRSDPVLAVRYAVTNDLHSSALSPSAWKGNAILGGLITFQGGGICRDAAGTGNTFRFIARNAPDKLLTCVRRLSCKLKRQVTEAFTLVELLVVVTVIGILAGLLIPGLARAKDSARSASCKSNLRQLGIALQLYVSDYEKYPGNGVVYVGGSFVEVFGTGLNWLIPYISLHGDSNQELYFNGGENTVFNCPGRAPRYVPGLFGGSGKTIYDLGYGYNELGTQWRQRAPMDSGFTVDLQNPWGPNLLASLTSRDSYQLTACVIGPSDMIAIGDTIATGWLTPNFPEEGQTTLRGPHSDTANVVFCDGHVENARNAAWSAPSEIARSRWNSDNLPHPETWR